jgi:hypothetical protein
MAPLLQDPEKNSVANRFLFGGHSAVNTFAILYAEGKQEGEDMADE